MRDHKSTAIATQRYRYSSTYPSEASHPESRKGAKQIRSGVCAMCIACWFVYWWQRYIDLRSALPPETINHQQETQSIQELVCDKISNCIRPPRKNN